MQHTLGSVATPKRNDETDLNEHSGRLDLALSLSPAIDLQTHEQSGCRQLQAWRETF